MGGLFTDADGQTTTEHIARFDGTTWQPLGPGLNSDVEALAVAPNGDV